MPLAAEDGTGVGITGVGVVCFVVCEDEKTAQNWKMQDENLLHNFITASAAVRTTFDVQW